MRIKKLASLGVALSLWVVSARADDGEWRPITAPPIVEAAGWNTPGVAGTVSPTVGSTPRPAVSVSLGRPVGIPGPAPSAVPEPVTTVAYQQPQARHPIVRAQSPDPLAGGGLAPPVPPPGDAYNWGIVTDPVGAPPPQSFWGQTADFANQCLESVGGTNGLCSDKAFEGFASPVTNPFYFEDPRALTEFRPIFIYQKMPGDNLLGGGTIYYYGAQGRLALTPRFQLSITKFGGLTIDPKNDFIIPSESGFAEMMLGMKYTFIRNDQTNTLASVGLNFTLPIGNASVFQDTGNLALVPYFSFGQNFWRSSYGSFGFLNSTGYTFRTDSERSEFFFSSFQLSYDIANLHRIYPLVELNWFYYAKNGSVRPFDFEGRDLINFGSTNVSGNNSVSLAAGMRFKFNDYVQMGGAFEFPVTGSKDLMDYRLTFDLIFRY